MDYTLQAYPHFELKYVSTLSHTYFVRAHITFTQHEDKLPRRPHVRGPTSSYERAIKIH